jgi:hypothetical protein
MEGSRFLFGNKASNYLVEKNLTSTERIYTWKNIFEK